MQRGVAVGVRAARRAGSVGASRGLGSAGCPGSGEKTSQDGEKAVREKRTAARRGCRQFWTMESVGNAGGQGGSVDTSTRKPLKNTQQQRQLLLNQSMPLRTFSTSTRKEQAPRLMDSPRSPPQHPSRTRSQLAQSIAYDDLGDLIESELFGNSASIPPQLWSISRNRNPIILDDLHEYTAFPLHQEDQLVPSPDLSPPPHPSASFSVNSPQSSIAPLSLAIFQHQLALMHAHLLHATDPYAVPPANPSEHPFILASQTLARLRRTNPEDVKRAVDTDPRAVALLAEAEAAWIQGPSFLTTRTPPSSNTTLSSSTTESVQPEVPDGRDAISRALASLAAFNEDTLPPRVSFRALPFQVPPSVPDEARTYYHELFETARVDPDKALEMLFKDSEQDFGPANDDESWLSKVEIGSATSPTLTMLHRVMRLLPRTADTSTPNSNDTTSATPTTTSTATSYISTPPSSQQPNTSPNEPLNSMSLQFVLDRLSQISSLARSQRIALHHPGGRVASSGKGKWAGWEWSHGIAEWIRGDEKLSQEGRAENVSAEMNDDADVQMQDMPHDDEVRALVKWIGAEEAAYVAIIETLKVLTSPATTVPISGIQDLSAENADAPASSSDNAPLSAPYNHLAGVIGRSVHREYLAKCVDTYENARLQAKLKKLRQSDAEPDGEPDTASNGVPSEVIMKKAISGGMWERVEGLLSKAHAAVAGEKFDMPWLPNWTLPLAARVGAFLLDALIATARLPSKDSTIQPFAFSYKKVLDNRGDSLIQSRLIGVVEAREEVREWANASLAGMEASYLPMICQPRNWAGVGERSGPYYGRGARIMHFTPTAPSQLAYLRAADSRQHLTHLFSALSYLGSIPWRVNDVVLPTVIELWNSGVSLGDMPPAAMERRIPPPALSNGMKAWKERRAKGEVGREEIRDFAIIAAARAKWLKDERERYSRRCDAGLKVVLAAAMAGRPIWFPHHIDFRGRAYPVPPNLNHIGNDLSRSLLRFDLRKPLGDRGWFWLKVHLANTYGFDKASFEDRVKWTEERINDVLDSARNPLGGNGWWKKADSPYQCLAVCHEVARAMEHPEGPEKYESGLPVQMDGSCNGMQHYAALGGDSEGAFEVNLVPREKPGDVYTGVAKIVGRIVDEDASAGNAIARMAQGKVTRALVKQTVMTQSYGVTFIGAREQISARLVESRTAGEHVMDDRQIFQCASYLAILTNRAVAEMFSGARAIQQWLNDIARIVCSSADSRHIDPRGLIITDVLEEMGIVKGGKIEGNGVETTELEDLRMTEDDENDAKTDAFEGKLVGQEASRDNLHDGLLDHDITGQDDVSSSVTDSAVKESSTKEAKTKKTKSGVKKRGFELPPAIQRNTMLVWTTPLGLPVVQPYRKFPMRSITTRYQRLVIADPTLQGSTNHQKQSSAFPPNFIHSLDATHMMLTALHMKALGLTFAAVHDSFWTHAADVDELGRVLREEFVRLHSTGPDGKGIMEKLRDELLERFGNNKLPVRVTLPLKTSKVMWEKVLKLEAEREVATASRMLADDGDLDAIIEVKSRYGKKGRAMSKRNLNSYKVGARAVLVWVDIKRLFPELPKRGDFDVRAVMGSPYFFH